MSGTVLWVRAFFKPTTVVSRRNIRSASVSLSTFSSFFREADFGENVRDSSRNFRSSKSVGKYKDNTG